MKFNFESWQEFLDWNVKRENHIKELEDENKELELTRLKNEQRIEGLEVQASPEVTQLIENFVKAMDGKNDKMYTFQNEGRQIYLQIVEDFIKEYKNATAENSDE